MIEVSRYTSTLNEGEGERKLGDLPNSIVRGYVVGGRKSATNAMQSIEGS